MLLTTEAIQAILDENKALIQACLEFQSLGKVAEANEFQKRLHKNLSQLAMIADKTVSSKKSEE